jgi:glycosyltransferase involved in cell wall biosynthesis
MFAGDGTRRQDVQALVNRLHLQNYVHFLGYTTCIPELLYYTDIKVLAGEKEGFGIALLEAAFMKKPLVGTRGTGMESIIKHEKTGLLFRRGDDEDLALQLKCLIDNPTFRKQLGQEAYAFALSNYSTERCLYNTLAFYTRVLV